ncbi:uncharacterized protein LOC119740640 [Patiria miniata]|uniref:Peptidase aspartic putative domain-containing protein n=1 Tax=Patiria miniata TaxID=46514 RepID=A0A914B925_PATMI|nr:uncharacterized protein LOC119740640 [Patiria miniata]
MSAPPRSRGPPSLSSRHSVQSNVSLAAAEARAAAEAARTRADYTRRQIEMKVERARLDAMLVAMQEEGEAQSALAAAKVLEEAADTEAAKDRASTASPPVLQPEAMQRTEEYVKTHFDHEDQRTTQVDQKDNPIDNGNSHLQTVAVDSQDPLPPRLPQNPLTWQAAPPIPTMSTPLSHTPHYTCTDVADHHNMYGYNSGPNRNLPRLSDISDLTAHLARRDLLSAGLKVFDNRPENYLSWKASYRNVTRGLNFKPSEKLDLLTKWLGGESQQHAMRIRAVHINNPSAGLDMVWQRLDKKYGSPEAIETSLFSRLEKFPKIGNRDYLRLQELADLLAEVKAAKLEDKLPGLSYLDTARGTNPIVEKLPHYLQEKWLTQGSTYKKTHRVPFPPFSFFVNFVYSQAEMRTDPSFVLQPSNATTIAAEKPSPNRFKPKSSITVHKTVVGTPATPSSDSNKQMEPDKQCPIHKKPHSLRKCRWFRRQPLEERKAFLKEHAICYRCCASTAHQAKDCKVDIRCSECGSDCHVSALHAGPPPWTTKDPSSAENHGGEQVGTEPTVAAPNCTEVCGEGMQGKSCSKICLANVFPEGQPEQMRKVYVMLDDQSNHSLARSTFFNIFGICGDISPYILRTCSGTTGAQGRRASGFTIQSVDGEVQLSLPPPIECDFIPNNRDEIPTPEAAKHHPHLETIAHKIPPLDPSAEIVLLLGRDIIQVHKVLSQCNGPHNAPYAQRLVLGWVIVGDVCLGGAHKPAVNANKTSILDNGRPSYLTPCESRIHVKETFTNKTPWHASEMCQPNNISSDIFRESPEDYKKALSVEDEIFLSIMNDAFVKDDGNSWVAPLPFRCPRRRLPDNRQQVVNRLMSLRRMLLKKPEMKDHYLDFMKKIFTNGNAELAPHSSQTKNVGTYQASVFITPKSRDK